MDLRKTEPSKPLPQVPCKVCARLIPEPLTYCSSECERIDEVAREHTKGCPNPKLLESTETTTKANIY